MKNLSQIWRLIFVLTTIISKIVVAEPLIDDKPEIKSYNEGVAYQQSGSLAKAVEAYKAALDINSELAPPWMNLGIIYFLQGQTLKSKEALIKSSELADRQGKSNIQFLSVYYLAELCSKEHSYTESEDYFEKALLFDPKKVGTLTYLQLMSNYVSLLRSEHRIDKAVKIESEQRALKAALAAGKGSGYK